MSSRVKGAAAYVAVRCVYEILSGGAIPRTGSGNGSFSGGVQQKRHRRRPSTELDIPGSPSATRGGGGIKAGGGSLHSPPSMAPDRSLSTRDHPPPITPPPADGGGARRGFMGAIPKLGTPGSNGVGGSFGGGGGGAAAGTPGTPGSPPSARTLNRLGSFKQWFSSSKKLTPSRSGGAGDADPAAEAAMKPEVRGGSPTSFISHSHTHHNYTFERLDSFASSFTACCSYPRCNFFFFFF